MAAAPAAGIRGRGWTLSVQRWRAAPEPGLSSNLGAAPVAALPRRGRTRRVATRLEPGERLWVAVTARPQVPVSARLADGRAVTDEALSGASEVLHRFSRIEGTDDEGLGAGDLLRHPAADAASLEVRVGVARIRVTVLAAPDFDAAFGPPVQVEGEPAVYAAWRLP